MVVLGNILSEYIEYSVRIYCQEILDSFDDVSTPIS